MTSKPPVRRVDQLHVELWLSHFSRSGPSGIASSLVHGPPSVSRSARHSELDREGNETLARSRRGRRGTRRPAPRLYRGWFMPEGLEQAPGPVEQVHPERDVRDLVERDRHALEGDDDVVVDAPRMKPGSPRPRSGRAGGRDEQQDDDPGPAHRARGPVRRDVVALRLVAAGRARRFIAGTAARGVDVDTSATRARSARHGVEDRAGGEGLAEGAQALGVVVQLWRPGRA